MTADAAGLTEFYDYTRRLLLDTQRTRDMGKLRRCNIRVKSARFKALSHGRQDDLLTLLAQAEATMTGMGLT